ncbi:P-type conjugative transfer protein TrbL, partial [Brucella intermedia GD04153]|nr:P-type conjugative transfer protein TrbL [Brucella intermedia GD04153]
LGGVARAAGSAAVSPLKRAVSKATESVKSSFSDGAKAGFGVTGGSSTMGTVGGGSAAPAASSASAGSPPAWAQRMRRSQAMNHGTTMAAHAVRSGDSHGSGSSVNLSERGRS